MKKLGKIVKLIVSSVVIAIYIAMIAVLVAQALTPGEESANISQSFGDKLNDAIGEISTPESSKVAVTGVSISSVTVGDEKLKGDVKCREKH
jgi:hypothetical protein